MRRRLSKVALLLIFLILVVLSGNQVIIGLFSRFSEKLILENHELNALHELKGALGKILIYDNQYLINHEKDIRASVSNANDKFENCTKELSLVHKGDTWEKVSFMFTTMNRNIDMLMDSPSEDGVLQHVISHQILDLISEVESLIDETVHEIIEYEDRSQKVKVHGTITVIVIGTLLILIMVFGSLRFIRGLTRPIGQLLKATKKIGDGDRNLRIHVDSGDEFQVLAGSFNKMLDALNETSISEKYLNNILNNLYGALLVTDSEAKITSINTTTSRMLKFKESDLIGKDILSLFGDDKSKEKSSKDVKSDLSTLSKRISKTTLMTDREGNEIPVYVTSVVLNNAGGEPEGMITVAHDQTEEKKHEAKMEKLRKERMIAIHEAQELERLRISRDLHDGLGQILTGISYSIQKIDEDNTIEKKSIQHLEKQVTGAIQETRNIAQNLTPIVLKDFGLLAAIENMVQRTNQHKKTQFLFRSYSFTERIDSKLEKAIFRICQEAVNNIMKHAKAKEATIELYRVEDMIVLVVEDDGKGFDTENLDQNVNSEGLGLISMRERADVFNGELSIISNKDRGTELILEIPCRKRKKNGEN